MKAYKAILRAYGGFKNEFLSSTTIAGGIVYGMVKNNDTREYNILFSNFRIKNKIPVYTTRVKLDRIANKSEPYLTRKFLERASQEGHKISAYNYAEYEGYIIAEKEDEIKELFERYGVFIGDNFVIFELGKLKEAELNRGLCVNSLPLLTLEEKILLEKLRASNVRVRIQRFTNSNYLDINPYIIYYDVKDDKVKKEDEKKVIYLVDFTCNERKDVGSYYSDLSSISEHFVRQYVKMGTGVISPCD